MQAPLHLTRLHTRHVDGLSGSDTPIVGKYPLFARLFDSARPLGVDFDIDLILFLRCITSPSIVRQNFIPVADGTDGVVSSSSSATWAIEIEPGSPVFRSIHPSLAFTCTAMIW
ncbi:MAG: hypothetical protein JW384_00671 [Nitrosomonadaceae bacterium]|nr:hypothetical protein [Nitrosomonadaceae bacterium]